MTHARIHIPPSNIRTMSYDSLKEHFGARSSGRIIGKRLLRALILQVSAAIRRGEEDGVDGNLRSFYYRFVKPVYARIPGGLAGRSDPYEQMLDVFVELVRDRKLISYAELDLVDDNWQHRRLGTTSPGTVLYAEKAGFFRWLVRQHEQLGVTVMALGGAPSLLSSEYLLAQLRRASWTGPLTLIGIVDWDPSGWALAQAFEDQLGALGAELHAHHQLVSPSLLDPTSLAWTTYPLPARQKTLNRRWLDATGGIDGQLLGLEADAIPKATLAAQLPDLLPKKPVGA